MENIRNHKDGRSESDYLFLNQARPKGVRWVRPHPLLELKTCFLLVIEVGDVRRHPYPVSGKLTQNFVEEKKSVGVTPPPPPPPRARSSAFSGLARLSRLAARRTDLVQNPHPPPPPFSKSFLRACQ